MHARGEPVELVQFLVRFLAGGLLVGALPLVARRVNPGLAGILLQVPIVTFATVYFVGHVTGSRDTYHTVVGALMGLPIYAVAVLGVLGGLALGMSVNVALALGALSWAVALATTVFVTGAYR